MVVCSASSCARVISLSPYCHVRLLGTVAPSTAPSTSREPGYIGYLSHAFTNIITNFPKWNTVSPPQETKKPAVVEKKIELRISRSEVTSRTKILIQKLLLSESCASQLQRMRDFCEHLQEYPPTKLAATQLISLLMKLESSSPEDKVRAEARLCLKLCGIVNSPKGRGVNLLAIDGGGTRGMMGLEVLEAIEVATGKKMMSISKAVRVEMHELFDHIVGVSTGAIISVMLGIKKMRVKECREVYMDISAKLFKQNRISGATGLLFNHSYYDTKRWIVMLKEILGETTMADSGRSEDVPNVSVVSSIVNLPILQPFIFRNYESCPGRESHYRGSTLHPLWTAVQASAAAPGYFEEVVLGSILHQDGGVIANNPSAIAIHETKSIYPDEEINCLVSVGNGRTVQELEPAPTVSATRTHHKILKIIDSATDTEAVHISMRDLLHERVYYRLNPYMTHPYGLDEIDPHRLEQMVQDAKLYVRRNSCKIDAVSARLLRRPTPYQMLTRHVHGLKLRRGHYSPP